MRQKNAFTRREVLSGGALCLTSLLPWPAGALTGTSRAELPRLRFAVLADAHVDLRGENRWRMGAVSLSALEVAVASCNGTDLDFVLVPGDLLYDGEWQNLFAAREVLDRLTVPWMVVSGNHDYRPADRNRERPGWDYLDTPDFISTLHGHGFDSSLAPFWSRKVHPGLRVIALDGCLRQERVGWGGWLPLEQLAWLEDELATSAEPVLVMVHHCLLHWGEDEKTRQGRWFSLDNARAVRAVLAEQREKVLLVLSAHRHIGLHYRIVDDIPYFVLPPLNSHPMRLSFFTLGSGMLSWATPPLALSDALHFEAQRGLLETSWFSGLNPLDRDALMAFYENPVQASGRRTRPRSR